MARLFPGRSQPSGLMQALRSGSSQWGMPFASPQRDSACSRGNYKMKQLVFSLLCFLSISAAAANRYINSAASGSSTGVDWTNAWPNWSSIKWASINPGDTVYVAGGVYSGQLTIGRSGTVRSPITIERVRSTDAAATAAAGWNPSFDSQVVQNAPHGNTGIYINQSIGSFVTIDGRRDAGWRINISDASSGVQVGQAAASNGTLRSIQGKRPGISE